jgi:hypothetical protein
MGYRAIERWTRPSDFAAWSDSWVYTSKAYVFLGRHRDSDLLTESNFECGLAAIGGESNTVQIVRESHWAVGWVEWIAIHESDLKALSEADEILFALSDYPVLCDEDFSEREYEAAQDYWESLDIRERVDLCRDAGLSIFAARSGSIPQGDSGFIYESCLGH